MKKILLIMLLLPIALWSDAQTTAEEQKANFFSHIEGTDATKQRAWVSYNNMFDSWNKYAKWKKGDERTLQSGWADEMYPSWKELMLLGPKSTSAIYNNGLTMMDTLLVNSHDAAMKQHLYEDLVHLFDNWIAYRDSVNAFESDTTRHNTQGDLMVYKSYYLNKYWKDANPTTYTLDSIYSLYSLALDEVRTKGGRAVPADALQQYVLTSRDRYYTNKEKYLEEYLQDYLNCDEACSNMLNLANIERDVNNNAARAKQIEDQYLPVQNNIRYYFNNSGVAASANLIAYYEGQIEKHKADVNYLDHALYLMYMNNCNHDSIYFVAANYAYDLKPSYLSAAGLAEQAVEKKEMDTAKSLFEEAISLADEDVLKSFTAEQAARSFTRVGGKLSEVREMRLVAIGFINQAIRYNPTARGRLLLRASTMYASVNMYDEALAAVREAERTDSRVKEEAHDYLANYTQKKADYDRRQRESQNNAAYKKAVAEYEAYRKRVEAEEAFWKGGKK